MVSPDRRRDGDSAEMPAGLLCQDIARRVGRASPLPHTPSFGPGHRKGSDSGRKMFAAAFRSLSTNRLESLLLFRQP